MYAVARVGIGLAARRGGPPAAGHVARQRLFGSLYVHTPAILVVNTDNEVIFVAGRKWRTSVYTVQAAFFLFKRPIDRFGSLLKQSHTETT